MEFLSTHTALTDALHALSQALLAPDIILLLAFACYAVFCIGSVLTEYFTERRNFKVAMPKFLAGLMAASEDDIPSVVVESGLLNRQKIALLTVYDYRTLPGDSLVALIRRVVNQEETRYDRITGRNNMAAKISPMLGLMGTLIPLGPGIAALGQADTSALSSSLLVAFDTTVAGLIVAAVCLAVGKIRSNWYNDYLSALDSGMATMLQKIEDMRADGTITAEEPTDYAFMFEQSIVKEKAKKSQAEQTAQVAGEVASDAASNAAGIPAGVAAGAEASALANALAAEPKRAESPFVAQPPKPAPAAEGTSAAAFDRVRQLDSALTQASSAPRATAAPQRAVPDPAQPEAGRPSSQATVRPAGHAAQPTASAEVPAQAAAAQTPTISRMAARLAARRAGFTDAAPDAGAHDASAE